MERGKRRTERLARPKYTYGAKPGRGWHGPWARLGVFYPEGLHHGEEALRLAMLIGRGLLLVQANASLGRLHLTQGNLAQAIRVLEQGLVLSVVPPTTGSICQGS